LKETAKLTQFESVIINGSQYIIALDDHGTLWKQGEGDQKWVSIPGPTISQHNVEDRAEDKRERVALNKEEFTYQIMPDGSVKVERKKVPFDKAG
jgi:hypothetical protein